jgi:cell division protein FtsW (lipid II flippase)
MKNLLKSEQAAQLSLAIIALYYQPIQFAWWVWILLFLAPDLGIVGYLINTAVGAVLYNMAHHKAIAGAFIIVGVLCHFPVLLLIGLLLWAHSSFDRIMGYGLKYGDSFQHTHLGTIGKQK